MSAEPCHGFLLLQKLKEHGYIEKDLDPAGFYRNLRKMEQDGYLVSRSAGNSPRSRRTYEITDFGRRALVNWEESLRKYGQHIRRITEGIRNAR